MIDPQQAQPESCVARAFFPRPLQLATVELDGAEAHHALHVLRATVGDRVSLFNGEGDEAIAEIASIRKRSAELRIIETWTAPPEPCELTLAVALPKGERARWLVEKATELGVTRIIPLRTVRSVVEPGEGKIEKLTQTAIAACKQCGQSRVPKLTPLTSLKDVLNEWCQMPNSRLPSDEVTVRSDCRLIAAPRAALPYCGAISQSTECRAILVFIGPEGDFTEDEFALAVSAGVTPVSLGPHVLRVETAAITVAAGWRLFAWPDQQGATAVPAH